jgi:hypothetical protein
VELGLRLDGIADGYDLAACPLIEEPSLPGSFVARPM